MEKKPSVAKRFLLGGLTLAIIISAVLLFIMWSVPKTAEFGSSGKFTEEQMQQIAQEVATDIGDGNYDAIIENSDEKLKKALTNLDWNETKETIGADWGAYKEVKIDAMTEIKKRNHRYGQVTATAQYENVSVEYLITCDPDGKLAGLYLR